MEALDRAQGLGEGLGGELFSGVMVADAVEGVADEGLEVLVEERRPGVAIALFGGLDDFFLCGASQYGDGLRLRHHSYDLLPVGGVIRRIGPPLRDMFTQWQADAVLSVSLI